MTFCAKDTVKSIIDRWLGQDCVKQNWYSKLSKEEKARIQMYTMKANQVTELDKRLSTVKFPEEMLRSMPKLRQHVGLKSMEYEVLLFYGWPLFADLIEINRLHSLHTIPKIRRHASRDATCRITSGQIYGRVRQMLFQ
jgi:hypothetical protein